MILMSINAKLALLPAAALLLSACAVPAADDDHPRVVVGFYAAQYAAERVVGEFAEVEALTQPGVDAHGLELSPSQVASISSADLVVHLEGFQPAVDDAVGQADHDRILDLADHVDLLAAEDGDHGDEHADDDHAEDEHAQDEHGEDDHADHDHGAFDPHFWQDPMRMAAAGQVIADRMAEAHPDEAERFRAGADALAADMAALDQEFTEGLSECTRREFVTTHEAFGYLADSYDLTEIAISGINPEGEPSPARIAEVHRLAEEHGITTIFFETLTSPAVAEAIAGDLGVATAVLDPLEGISADSPGDDYPSIMRANLEAIQEANDC